MTEDTYRGELKEPDTLHLYAYCKNNPINYEDPSGHFLISTVVLIGIGGIVGAIAGSHKGKLVAQRLGYKGENGKNLLQLMELKEQLLEPS